MKRVATLTGLVALLSFGLAVPVFAATPGNDTYIARQVIGSIPFTASVDTTEATTGAPDAEAVSTCASVPTDASVWYEYTPATDGTISVDTTGSDYAAGVVVVTGSPGSFAFENCGTSVVLSVVAGTAYEIMVFDFDGVGNGGNLELAVADVPPPPEIQLTIDASGSFNSRTGSATIRGSITCTGGDAEGKNDVAVDMTQVVGRVKFSAFNDTGFACDGAAHPWSIELLSSAGKFAGGKATVHAYANACAGFGCGFAEASRTVTLRK